MYMYYVLWIMICFLINMFTPFLGFFPNHTKWDWWFIVFSLISIFVLFGLLDFVFTLKHTWTHTAIYVHQKSSTKKNETWRHFFFLHNFIYNLNNQWAALNIGQFSAHWMALMNEWMNEKENSETKQKNIQWLIEIQIVMIIMMMVNWW